MSVDLIAHLKVDHGYTWKRLRELFPGLGRQAWDAVRHRIDDLEREAR